MKRSDIIIIILIIIVITTIILLADFAFKAQGILVKYAKNLANMEVNKIIDSTLREILSEEEFKNIIEIEKNKNQEITNINFNNSKINKILALSTNNVLNKLNENNTKIYNIPFGLISNNHLFHNLGPSIPYRISLLGQLNNNTFINIKEYGINNSMLEVILEIEIEYGILLAFTKDNQKTTRKIIIESKIIQGNIPNYYGNVNSLLN